MCLPEWFCGSDVSVLIAIYQFFVSTEASLFRSKRVFLYGVKLVKD